MAQFFPAMLSILCLYATRAAADGGEFRAWVATGDLGPKMAVFAGKNMETSWTNHGTLWQKPMIIP